MACTGNSLWKYCCYNGCNEYCSNYYLDPNHYGYVVFGFYFGSLKWYNKHHSYHNPEYFYFCKKHIANIMNIFLNNQCEPCGTEETITFSPFDNCSFTIDRYHNSLHCEKCCIILNLLNVRKCECQKRNYCQRLTNNKIFKK